MVKLVAKFAQQKIVEDPVSCVIFQIQLQSEVLPNMFFVHTNLKVNLFELLLFHWDVYVKIFLMILTVNQ